MTRKRPNEQELLDGLDAYTAHADELAQPLPEELAPLEGFSDLLEKIQRDLFLGDWQMMHRWLDTPVPALDGETPQSLMGTIAGRKVLEQYIQKLNYGDYC